MFMKLFDLIPQMKNTTNKRTKIDTDYDHSIDEYILENPQKNKVQEIDEIDTTKSITIDNRNEYDSFAK